MSEVKDVLGKPVKIGDTVAFAGAGRGASQFLTGEVVRFAGTMSVEIEHKTYRSGEGGYIVKDKTLRKDGCLVKLDRGHILLVATDEFKAAEVSVQYPASTKPLRINRLLAKLSKDLPPEVLSRAEADGRMTGETTGYLLSFLGQVISNPNKWHTIRKNPYGERARTYEVDSLKDMVEMLHLDFIEFRHSDKSVMFKLYEDFNGKYDLYNREVL